MWPEIIGIVGGGGALVAALGWLVQIIVKHRLDKDVALYRETLGKEMTELKAKLDALNLERQIRFSKLHEKRAEIIGELYRLLQLTDRRFQTVSIYMSRYAESVDKVAPALIEVFEQLREFYLIHKIYFGANFCVAADRLVKLLLEPTQNYQMWLRDGKLPEGYHGELLRQCNDALGELPLLRREIESEFRDMLGVDNTSVTSAAVKPS
jgi:hypothetical protein